MIVTAWSIVVRRAPSGAVLCTASVSASLIFGASLPMARASSRIGTTSATTTRTITMPIVYPTTQPVVAVPAARTCGSMTAPYPQTVSQKSRTGFRLALTEVSRSGTVLVSCATACTPPVVATRVARIARRWKMTLSRPTAVIAMISAAMISVTQAAAGMAVLLSRSAEKLRDRARVPDRAVGHFLDRLVGRGQRLRDAVQLADEGDPARQDLVGRAADPLQRREHAVEQEDHDREYDNKQDGVADPPPDHGSSPLRSGWAGRAGRSGRRPAGAPSSRPASPA